MSKILNKKRLFLILILVFIFSSFFGFFFTKFRYVDNQKVVAEQSLFLISKDNCEKLNTFRENYGNLDLEDLEKKRELELKENIVDVRIEEKFNGFHYENTTNVPIWKVILDPGEYGELFSDANTKFICFYDGTVEWSESHKVCNKYLRVFLYFLYDFLKIKIKKVPLQGSRLTNEWEYYKLVDNLDKNERYIVFYDELNLGGFTVIDLDEIDDVSYLKDKIDNGNVYNILCTNDFSCLHSWAIKEKFKTKGFTNIKNIVKFINLNMIEN